MLNSVLPNAICEEKSDWISRYAAPDKRVEKHQQQTSEKKKQKHRRRQHPAAVCVSVRRRHQSALSRRSTLKIVQRKTEKRARSQRPLASARALSVWKVSCEQYAANAIDGETHRPKDMNGGEIRRSGTTRCTNVVLLWPISLSLHEVRSHFPYPSIHPASLIRHHTNNNNNNNKLHRRRRRQKHTDTQVGRDAKLSSVSWWLVAGDDGNGLTLLLP